MKSSRSQSLPLRRSPVAARLRALGAVFEAFGEQATIVERMRYETSKKNFKLFLCDLSPLTRIGIKGHGTDTLLRRCSFALPSATNTSQKQKNGSLCLRLAANEVLLVSAIDSLGKGDFPVLQERLDNKASEKKLGANEAFLVPYQDSLCWFALCGEQAISLFAKVCAVDLNEGVFAKGSIAQTSLARLSAVILRDPTPFATPMPLFHIFADSASSLYLWDCLCDAMQEYQGSVCGRKDLLQFLEKR